MRDFFVEASGLIKAVSDYVNPVGRMYLKFQFIFRLLFSGVMLSDIMKTELVCDTMQIGCKDMCLNRFAPLTFPKLWQLEMYFILCVTGIFILFRWTNHRMHKHYHKHPEKYGGVARDLLQVRTKTIKKRGGTDVEYSRLISVGYFFMLVLRLSGEIGFVYLEKELGTHQSGIAGGPAGMNAFLLPEKYFCRTNVDEENYSKIRDSRMTLSSIFDEPSELDACSKQEYEVICYIPFSWMKQKGMIFMHFVLLGGLFLTILELCVVVLRFFKKRDSVVRGDGYDAFKIARDPEGCGLPTSDKDSLNKPALH